MIKLRQVELIRARKFLSLRCPSCRQLGSFEPIFRQTETLKDLKTKLEGISIYLGHRKCPNLDCNFHVFVIWDGAEIIATFPPERIDFDSSNIPDSIVQTFGEAITCHANKCYTASAIMVRRTLEEICQDKEATGNKLKNRIENLKKAIILPPELLNSLHNLRLLGNDAAHVEAKDFEEIGEKEVKVAIDVTKEILRATYQYEHLVKELDNLKKKNE